MESREEKAIRTLVNYAVNSGKISRIAVGTWEEMELAEKLIRSRSAEGHVTVVTEGWSGRPFEPAFTDWHRFPSTSGNGEVY